MRYAFWNVLWIAFLFVVIFFRSWKKGRLRDDLLLSLVYGGWAMIGVGIVFLLVTGGQGGTKGTLVMLGSVVGGYLLLILRKAVLRKY